MVSGVGLWGLFGGVGWWVGWGAAKKKVVTVAVDGSGDFKDVQAAVDSAPEGNVVVRIKPGTYKQLVNITTPGVELRGMGKQPQDVVLTYNNSHAMVNGTWKSASIMVSGDDFIAENLTMENSFEREHPKPGPDAQAVALFATGDRQVYRRVRFLGYQDTLYADRKTCHLAPAQQGGCRCLRVHRHRLVRRLGSTSRTVTSKGMWILSLGMRRRCSRTARFMRWRTAWIR